MTWDHGHSHQNLVINHDIHLVLAMDEAICEDGLDLNVGIGTREVEGEMGHFDAVPCFHIMEEMLFNIETRMARNNHIRDQGIFDSYRILARNCFTSSGSTYFVQVL